MTEITFTDDDLRSLFPTETVQIGKHQIFIEPFSLENLTRITEWVKSMQAQFAQKGLTMENVFEPDNMPRLAMLIARSGPALINMATGIKIADVNRLPISLVLDMSFRIIKVNLAAKAGLEKNFLASLVEMAQVVTSGLGTLPNSLSKTDTDGTTSKDTTSEK